MPAHALPIIGQIDTFEDGTTNNWIVNAAGGGAPSNPPTNIATGGPAGAGDNFMHLSSIGGGGSSSRLSVINETQWAGDYLAAGITEIAMDVNNTGANDVSLRLVFENPMFGPPTDVAFSDVPIVVPAGSGWMHIVFDVRASALQAGLGSINNALSQATAIRLYHSATDNFPNPVFPIAPIVAQLGVDNIQALPGSTVPEPASVVLLLSGLGTVLARRRLRRY